MAQIVQHPILVLARAPRGASQRQPAVRCGQRSAGEERAGPPRVTDLRKEGHGGYGAAPTLAHTGRAQPQGRPLVWSPPLFPPTSLPPMPRCLVEQPRTERLLAIRGRFPGPRVEEASAGLVLAALGVGCELSGREPYLLSAKTVKVYRLFTDFYLNCKSDNFCKCSWCSTVM